MFNNTSSQFVSPTNRTYKLGGGIIIIPPPNLLIQLVELTNWEEELLIPPTPRSRSLDYVSSCAHSLVVLRPPRPP